MEEDPFFSLTDDSEWNALIGDQGDKVSYAEGYIEAALELATLIIKENRFAQRDTLVMPILYNARHSIELHLKLIIDEFVEAGLLATGHRANHDIASQFIHLRDSQLPDLSIRFHLDRLMPFVDSLSHIDDDGQEFRYFENRDGDRSLEGKALANIAVIGRSLKELKTILSDLKYRTWTLCDEYRTGTHTHQLSRKDLFEIAAALPPRSNWSDPKFDVAKSSVKERFGMGSRQFSIALKRLQETRELKAALGIETELVYLNDDKAVFLAEQWKIIHPPRERSELGFDITNPIEFEKLFENADQEKAAREAIAKELTVDEIADAETIFYLARDKWYSEHYETALESKIREFKSKNDIRQEIYDLTQKTNFLMMFEVGVKKLGRLALADRLEQIKEQMVLC
jgi:hypothetical protein